MGHEVRQPLRVGIIGVGWGSVVQVPAFRAVAGYKVVALCARRPERATAAGEALEIADVTTDWRALVTRDDLDVISICTPVGLHYEQTMAAIAAGKHVLVEKPVGLDASQTGAMRDAAADAGVAHAVCFENRWEPARLRVWELVRSGHLGDTYLAHTRSTADFWHPTRATQSEWMYRRDQGGGYLMGLGSHDIDYLCTLFGEPDAVCADVRTTTKERDRPDGSVLEVDADDTSLLLLRMKNGMLATVSTTAVALGHNSRAFEAYGSGGSIAMEGPMMGEDQLEVRITSVEREGSELLAYAPRALRSGAELPKRRAAGAIRSLALMLEDWLPNFAGEDTDVPTLDDGHRVQRVIEAARRSSDGAGWVDL